MTTECEKFEGLAGQMRPVSPWLAAEDLDGVGDVKVTIEGVYKRTNVAAQDGRKEPTVFTMRFSGKQKEMWLKTAANRRKLVEKFGTNVKDWVGKEITLYVEDGVRSPKGGTTKGIRIR